MRAVAKRHVLRMLAGAPRDRLCLFDLDLFRFQPGSFMAPVAEGLTPGPPAGAPPVNAGLDLLDDRRFLENDWFRHIRRPPYPKRLWHPSDTPSCCLRGDAKRSINPSLQALSLESGQSEASRINASSAQKFKPFVRAAASMGGQCKEHFKLTFIPV